MPAKMVDISKKDDVVRIAVAEGFITLRKETIEAIKDGRIPKGDVLTVASIAAMLAVKKTPELIPMCHPIPITSVDVDFEINDEGVKVFYIIGLISDEYCTFFETVSAF